ncbi:MAG: putative lipid II flippase FtsW [Myxococcota bacterium]
MTRRYDTPLLVATLALLALGLAMVYSASSFIAAEQNGNPWHFVQRQGVAAGLGLALCAAAARTPYRKLAKWAPYLYGAGLFSLVLVWVPGIGHSAGGAARWFGVGGFHFQPAEFVKVVVLVGLAAWIQKNRGQVNDPKVLGVAAATIAPSALLILLQPDFGSFAIIALLCGIMVFLAGLRVAWVLALGGLGALGLGVVAIAEPYRMKRITSFLDPFADCSGAGYQVCQSLLALHHGGVRGQGPGEGVAKLLYLPEPQNDFIAAVLGEELGLVGMLVLMGLYAAFAWRGTLVARRAPDAVGSLLASTLTVMIVGQACLNLGVVMSVVPPKGLVLPFLSYGASAMMVNLGAVGILLSISAEAKQEATAPLGVSSVPG